MEILTTKKDDVLTVSLTGRLDTTTSPQLDEELKKSLDGIRELTMDLEGLEYICRPAYSAVDSEDDESAGDDETDQRFQHGHGCF